ncbi:unnamed protein product [Blepharisma stoltei]|uniref:Uncharacterized protein n=1 Tax=Blepharisma stoltei TaxID=1481888 RepID=A0AAU9IH34_9CILI|nr:unnamed protein product [Blepharisma stoltei]
MNDPISLLSKVTKTISRFHINYPKQEKQPRMRFLNIPNLYNLSIILELTYLQNFSSSFYLQAKIIC